MAITGTFAAGDEQTFNDVSVDIDLTPASSSFAAIESWMTNITISGGDTPSSTFNTYTTPMVFTGEKNPYTINCEIVFTLGATDPFSTIYAAYVAAPGLLTDLRWSPPGGASGEMQFLTVGGKLLDCTIPSQGANDSGAVLFNIMVQCSTITLGTAS